MFKRVFAVFGGALGHVSALLLAFNPLITPLVATRAQAQTATQKITVDPTAPRALQPGVGTSSGGKPVLDIVTPNAGVSHNRLQDLIAPNGLIFNNSSTAGASITGGAVKANPNLSGGKAANVILNEVRGGQGTLLGGSSEVFGARADLIIANENGVQCVGCAFVNVGRATLTSGAPTVDAAGNIALTVKRGLVGVWGAGLTGAAEAELIGREVVIDGKVEATDRITASGGTQVYDHRTRSARTAPASSTPRQGPYAVDATALGAMKSGDIRIIGNESGLGVRLDGKIVSGGNVSVRAQGDASAKNVEAKGRVSIEATGAIRQPDGTVKGDAGIAIAGRSFEQAPGARLASQGAITIAVADYVNLSGEVESQALTVSADKSIYSFGKVVAADRLAFVAGEAVSNERGEQKRSYIDAWVSQNIGWMNYYVAVNPTNWYSTYFRTLVSRADLGAGTVRAAANSAVIAGLDVELTAKAGSLTNTGAVTAARNAVLIAGTDIINRGGTITAGGNLSASAGRDILNQAVIGGDYRASTCAFWSCWNATVAQGVMHGGANVALVAGRDIRNTASTISSGGNIWLEAGTRGAGTLVNEGAEYRAVYNYYGGVQPYTAVGTEWWRHYNVGYWQPGTITSSGGNVTLVNRNGAVYSRGANVSAGRDLAILASGGVHSDYGVHTDYYWSQNRDWYQQWYQQWFQKPVTSWYSYTTGSWWNRRTVWAQRTDYVWDWTWNWSWAANLYSWTDQATKYAGNDMRAGGNLSMDGSWLSTGASGIKGAGDVALITRGGWASLGAVSAGRDLSVYAPGDLNLAAGTLSAGRDASVWGNGNTQLNGSLSASRNTSITARYGQLGLNGSVWSSNALAAYSYYDLTNRGNLGANGATSLYSEYGSIRNPGVISLGGDLSMRAYYNIENDNWINARNTTAVATYGDLVNRNYMGAWGGQLYGYAGGAIRNEAVVGTVARASTCAFWSCYDSTYRQAQMWGSNGVTLTAGTDLSNIGSTISSYYDIYLQAGRNGKGGTLTNTGREFRYTYSYYGGVQPYTAVGTEWWRYYDVAYWQPGAVTSHYGNLSLVSSSGDVVNRGANLHAGRDMSLYAAGNIRVEDGTHSDYAWSQNRDWYQNWYQVWYQRTEGSWWWRRTVWDSYWTWNWGANAYAWDARTAKSYGNNLKAGASLYMQGNNVALHNATVSAGVDLNVYARTGQIAKWGSGSAYAGRDVQLYANTNIGISGATSFGRDLTATAQYGALDITAHSNASANGWGRNASLYAYGDLVSRGNIYASGTASLYSNYGSLWNTGAISAGSDAHLRAYYNLDSNYAYAGRNAYLTAQYGTLASTTAVANYDVNLYAYYDLHNRWNAQSYYGNASLWSNHGSIYQGGGHLQAWNGNASARAYYNIDSYYAGGRNTYLTAQYGTLSSTHALANNDLNLYAYYDINNRHNAQSFYGNASLWSNYGSINSGAGHMQAAGDLNARAYYSIDSYYANAGRNLSAVATYGNLTNRYHMAAQGGALYGYAYGGIFNEARSGWNYRSSACDMWGGCWSGYVAPSTIYGRDSVTLLAGWDVRNNASTISSYGNINIEAGRVYAGSSIWNVGQEYRATYNYQGGAAYGHEWQRHYNVAYWQPGTIQSYGGNVALTSWQGDIWNKGGNIAAAGDLKASAAGGLRLEQVTLADYNWGWDRNWSQYWYSWTSGSWWWRRTHWAQAWTYSDNVWSNWTNKTIGNTFTAGRDLTVDASWMRLEGVTLKAPRDLTVIARSGELRGDSIGTFSAGRDLTVQAHTNLKLWGDLLFGRDINLRANYGWADLNINVQAPRDVNVYAYYDITNRKAINAGGSANLYSEYGSIYNTGSVKAGGNANLRAYHNIDSNYVLGTNTALTATYGSLSSTSAYAYYGLTLSAYSDINNRYDARSYYGNATLVAQTGSINAAGGHLQAHYGTATATAAKNIDSYYVHANTVNLTATAGTLTNRYWIGGSALSLKAPNLSNSGTISSYADLTLALTGTITNRGTISAARDLTLTAGGNIENLATVNGTSVTKAVISAGRDLVLDADAYIRNIGGRISAGHSLIADAGLDIVNEAVKTSFTIGAAQGCLGAACGRLGFGYSAAQIVSQGGMILTAGASILNKGSEIVSEGSIMLQAAGDVRNESLSGKYAHVDYYNSWQTCSGSWFWKTCTNHVDQRYAETAVISKAIIAAKGGDLYLTAGGNLINRGGLISAKGNLDIEVGGDIILQAVSVELITRNAQSSSKKGGLFGGLISFGTGKGSSSEDANGFSTIMAGMEGGEVWIHGDGNFIAQGASIAAKRGLALNIWGDVVILAMQNTTYRNVSISSSGFLGTNKYSYDAATQRTVTTRSAAEAGDGLAIVSEARDITLQAANLKAGGDVTLEAKNGRIAFLSAKETEYTRTQVHSENLVWWKKTDNGRIAETVLYSHILAGGRIVIKAKDGVYVEYQEGGSIDDAIRKLARTDGLGWMADLRVRNDVEWKAVAAQLETWNYKQEGLTQGAAALIAIAVTIATQGAGASLLGALSLGGNAILTAATQAAISTIASRAAVSLINNKGDISKVLKELGSSDFIKQLAVSIITAGLTSGFEQAGLIPTSSAGNSLTFAEKMQASIIRNVVGASVETAIVGGDIAKTLLARMTSAGVNDLLAVTHNLIGDYTDGANKLPLANLVAHAMVGGLAARAVGGSFAAGAAAGLASALAAQLDLFKGLSPAQIAKVSQLIGGTAALLAGGNGTDVNQGATTAQSAAINNYLTHAQLADATKAQRDLLSCQLAILNRCSQERVAELKQTIADYQLLSAKQTARMLIECEAGGSGCAEMLAHAREFTERVTRDRIAGTGIGGIPAPVGADYFYVSAGGHTGLDTPVNLDALAVRYFSQAVEGKITYAQASKLLMESIVAHDSNLKLFVGGVQVVGGIATIAACSATGALACAALALLGSANITLGSNRVFQGVSQHLTNAAQRSVIEQALVDLGYTPAQARRYLENTELLVGIADLAAGGALILSGPSGIRATVSTGGQVGYSNIPSGYRPFRGGVGAAANETGGLPVGYQRVINNATGDIEILGPSGTVYRMAEYDAYVASKPAGQARSYQSYVEAREHWARGSAAHRAEVDRQVALYRQQYPDARIETLSSLRSADGCTTCFPDIMIVNRSNQSVVFVEVKTGNAEWTRAQNIVYRQIEDGTAVLTNEQAIRLGVGPGTTVRDAFPGGATVQTRYGAGYLTNGN